MRSRIQTAVAILFLAAFGCRPQAANPAKPIKPGMTRKQVEKHYEMEIGTRGAAQYVYRGDGTTRYTVRFRDRKSWPWQDKGRFSRDVVTSAHLITTKGK